MPECFSVCATGLKRHSYGELIKSYTKNFSKAATVEITEKDYEYSSEKH